MIKKVFTNAFINIICKLSMQATKENRGFTEVVIPCEDRGTWRHAVVLIPRVGYYADYTDKQSKVLWIKETHDGVFKSIIRELQHFSFSYSYNSADGTHRFVTLSDQ